MTYFERGQHELKAVHDSAKSFYGKAYYVMGGGGNFRLFSFGTHVATATPWDKSATVLEIRSSTTLRHIKEFLKQHGFKAETKAQIENDYLMK